MEGDLTTSTDSGVTDESDSEKAPEKPELPQRAPSPVKQHTEEPAHALDESEQGDVSESVDPELLRRGFASDDEDDKPPLRVPVRRAQDDEEGEEDWADQELRELRRHMGDAVGDDKERRRTINGIDIAPRSELSPPPNPAPPEPEGEVFVYDVPTRKPKTFLTFNKSASVARGATTIVHADKPVLEKSGSSVALKSEKSSGERSLTLSSSGTVAGLPPAAKDEGSGSDRRGYGTLARISSKLRDAKHRKSTSDVAFDKPATSSANSSNSNINNGAGAAAGAASTTAASSSFSLSSSSAAAPAIQLNNADLFRYVLEKVGDGSEGDLLAKNYVCTIAYFSDPAKLLQNVVAEFDRHAAEIEAMNGGANANAADLRYPPSVERLLRLLSIWLRQAWCHFENSAILRDAFNRFVSTQLRGSRWAKDLTDLVAELTGERKKLLEAIDFVKSFGESVSPLTSSQGSGSVVDLFELIDPETVDEEVDDEDSDDVVFISKTALSGDESLSPRPADGGGSSNSTSQRRQVSPHATIRETMVGADKYNAESKPMGLFGIMETTESEDTIWDLGRLDFSKIANVVHVEEREQMRAADMAKQLTLIDCLLWKRVTVVDIQKSAWKTDDPSLLSAPGRSVRELIAWHNRLAHWVQYLILSQERQVDRVKRMQRVLSLVLCLEKLANYHTAFALMTGLKVGTVARLRLHQQLNAKWRATHDRLAELTNMRGNWRSYRHVISLATRPSCHLPFLGVLLQDIQVLEGKEKTYIGDEVGENAIINMTKVEHLGGMLQLFTLTQRGCTYRFKPLQHVLSYLMALKPPADDELIRMSHKLQPANDQDHFEKTSAILFLAAVVTSRSRDISADTSTSDTSPRGPSGVGGAGGGGGGSAGVVGVGGGSASASSGLRESSAAHVAAVEAVRLGLTLRSHSPQASPRGGSSSSESRSASTSPRKLSSVSDMCPICNSLFASQKELCDHLLKQTCLGAIVVKAHACPVCQVSFATKDELLAHLRSVRCAPRPVLTNCPVCRAWHPSTVELKDHLQKRTCFPK